jgi:hypothetical protein
VFLQNYRGLRIIGFKGIIFLLKIPWNMSTVSWTGAQQRGPPAQGLHKTGAVQITMEGSDPPGEGVRLFSNLDRYGEDGQRGSNWSLGEAAAIAAPHKLAGALL